MSRHTGSDNFIRLLWNSQTKTEVYLGLVNGPIDPKTLAQFNEKIKLSNENNISDLDLPKNLSLNSTTKLNLAKNFYPIIYFRIFLNLI